MSLFVMACSTEWSFRSRKAALTPTVVNPVMGKKKKKRDDDYDDVDSNVAGTESERDIAALFSPDTPWNKKAKRWGSPLLRSGNMFLKRVTHLVFLLMGRRSRVLWNNTILGQVTQYNLLKLERVFHHFWPGRSWHLQLLISSLYKCLGEQCVCKVALNPEIELIIS